MTIQEIYQLAINKAIESDLRGREVVAKTLAKRKEKYEGLSEKEKADFDLESLTNPYPDSGILNISEDKEIKKILVGIDIDAVEFFIAKELGSIDLVISHHPRGKCLTRVHETMEMQSEILNKYGVPINVAENLLETKISEVARGTGALNYQRSVDTAKILKVNFICLHTVCDNLAAEFLEKEIEKKSLERVGEIVDLLKDIPEYREAEKNGAGPKISVGSKESRCGKIALSEITGGTEGTPKIYEKMALAGVGTVITMHQSEEHRKEAQAANINVVMASHMASDSLGVNLLLDELEKKGIEIIPCSGLIRVKRA